MSRTTARLLAIGSTTVLALTLAAGTASAGGDDYSSDDQRCQKANVVCTPIDVNLGELDVLNNLLHGHGHH